MDDSTSSTAEASYFEPLGTKETLKRAWLVFRKRWKQLLVTSAMGIFLWYVVAIGVRALFDNLSVKNTKINSFEMNGENFAFQWQYLRTTFSRLGLGVEFLLVFLLHLPADATNIRMVAELYAGKENWTLTDTMRSALPKFGPLFIACLAWCWALLLPLLLVILWMAPEGQEHRNGLEYYFLPLWPKVIGGTIFLIYSTIFMVATYFCYANILIQGNTSGIASLRQSYELSRTGSQWKHSFIVLFIWFLIKVAITKCVTAVNYWYYLKDPRFWIVWSEPGIPLLPGRILWSSMDLWEVGRSWISVAFVVFLAAMGSVFQAVLYIDARVKQEKCTKETLSAELGLEDTEYKTMDDEKQADTTQIV